MSRLRVTVGGVIAGTGQWSNTLEFALGANIASQAALQTVVNGVHTALAASSPYKASVNSDTTMRSVKALFYLTGSPTASLVAESGQASFIGTAASQHAPQVCVVASYRTGNAGRSYRGRSYWPYRAGGVSIAGIVSPSAQGVVAAGANALAGAIVAQCALISVPASWVVYSPKTGATTPITAILVGSQCDTMRHRNMNRDETFQSFPLVAPLLTPDSVDLEELLSAVKNAKINTGIDNFAQALLDVVPYVP